MSFLQFHTSKYQFSLYSPFSLCWSNLLIVGELMAHLWNQICVRKLPQKNGKEHFFWFAYLVQLISCSGFYVKMLSDVHVALIYSFFFTSRIGVREGFLNLLTLYSSCSEFSAFHGIYTCLWCNIAGVDTIDVIRVSFPEVSIGIVNSNYMGEENKYIIK